MKLRWVRVATASAEGCRAGLQHQGLGAGGWPRMMGSHGGCVSRGTAKSSWGQGAGQGLALTSAPLPAATPQSGTNSSWPPAIPEARLTCCLSCGPWPPCRQKRPVSEVRETKAGRAAARQQGLPRPGWASHQLHSAGQDTSALRAPISSSVTHGVRTGPTSRGCRGD